MSDDAARFGRTRPRGAVAVYSMAEACKFNDVDPRAWLVDVFAKLPHHSAHHVGELMP